MNCSRRVPPIINGLPCTEMAVAFPRILGWARTQKDHPPFAMDFTQIPVCKKHMDEGLAPQDIISAPGWAQIQTSLQASGKAPLIASTLELVFVTIE